MSLHVSFAGADRTAERQVAIEAPVVHVNDDRLSEIFADGAEAMPLTAVDQHQLPAVQLRQLAENCALGERVERAEGIAGDARRITRGGRLCGHESSQGANETECA